MQPRGLTPHRSQLSGKRQRAAVHLQLQSGLFAKLWIQPRTDLVFKEKNMLLIILIVLILGFGYGGYRVGPGWGYYGGGGLSLLLTIVLVLLLLKVI